MPDPNSLIRAAGLTVSGPGGELFRDLSFTIAPGLTWIVGGEGRGKTTLLRLLAGEQQPSEGSISHQTSGLFWEGSVAPRSETITGQEWLQSCRDTFVAWDLAMEAELTDEFGLAEHVGKGLYMLSKGSRRKLGLVGAFACGANVALLDTPFAALDGRSRQLLMALLTEASEHPRRAWVVADFEIPADFEAVTPTGLVKLGD